LPLEELQHGFDVVVTDQIDRLLGLCEGFIARRGSVARTAGAPEASDDGDGDQGNDS
jgi:hypothetical protein